MTENRENLLVVDGMALLFRAFYATAVSKQFMFNQQGYRRMGARFYAPHVCSDSPE